MNQQPNQNQDSQANASSTAPANTVDLSQHEHSFEQVFTDRDGNAVLTLRFDREIEEKPQINLHFNGAALTIYDVNA
jgi:hypothetical protein